MEAVNNNHAGHMELWDDLYRYPEEIIIVKNKKFTRLREKFDWPGWKMNGGEWANLHGSCFACKATTDATCDTCPINWGNHALTCESARSPYRKWDNATNPKKRSYYARIIRDLKWGKETEDEEKEKRKENSVL